MPRYTEEDVQSMELKGRSPSYDARGSIRGFRSRPGAPLAKQDSMTGLGIAYGPNDTRRQNAWDAFFGKTASAPATPSDPADPSPPPATPAEDYMGADLSALPSAPPVSPQSRLQTTIDGQTSWLTRNGLTPQAPSYIPPPSTTMAASPTRNFRSRYGTASVSFQPQRVSYSNPWGKPLPLDG
jgi:hypothetical protein